MGTLRLSINTRAGGAARLATHSVSTRRYGQAMKVRTSVALSKSVLAALDRRAGGPRRRSALIERAVRSYLSVDAPQRADLTTINRHAKRLNEEAEDVLSYQVIP